MKKCSALTKLKSAFNRALFLTIALLLSIGLFAQEKKSISGTVKDPDGISTPGVSVLVKGTTVGTITDADGNYRLSIPANAKTIVFSFVGMNTIEKEIGNNAVIDVLLSSQLTELDETVVIAYGTKKKRDMVGSVSKVKAEDLKLSTGGNFMTSLQGKASGVQIVTDGLAGSTPQIKIRGIRSISSGTDPLWVVDGMIGGSVGSLNFRDIESVDILKDAAATAIYGSRGSNGVIIVTTKKGVKGAPVINVDYEYGVTPIIKNNLNIASTAEFFKAYDQARINTGRDAFDPQRDVVTPFWTNCDTPITRAEAEAVNINYNDEVSRLGNYNDVNLSVSQGSDNVSNYASFNYRNDVTSLKGRDLQSLNARFNTDYKKGKLSFGFQTQAKYANGDNISQWGKASLVPFYKLYDSNSATGYWNPKMGNGTTGDNPMSNMDSKYRQNESINMDLRLNAYAEIAITKVKGLALRGDASFGYGVSQNNQWISADITRNSSTEGTSASRNKNTSYTKQYHLFAKYNRTFGEHAFDAVSGFEINRGYSDYLLLSGRNVVGVFQEMASIGTFAGNSTGYIGNEGYTKSFFNRLDYKFKERYLLGASFVREGTSRFAEQNRWGNFYSASAGWIISDESFMKNITWISMLKLRGSYGETGNQNIPSDASITSYATRGTNLYNNWTNSYQWSVPNRDARWEKTASTDFGIDFGFLKNKISGSIAYYRQNVSDMLLQVALPASAGIPTSGFGYGNTIWANMGDMYNQGFEFDVTYNIINKKDFTWSSNLNLTTNGNMVTALSPSVDAKGTGIISTRPGTITKKGLPIGTYFMPEYAGIDPDKGIPMIWEIDQALFAKTGETVKTGNKIPGTGTNANKNRIIQEGKTGMPTFYAGWTNNLTWKNFDMSCTLYYSTGNYILDRFNQGLTMGDGRANFNADMLNKAWQKPGDIADYPQLRWQGLYNYKDDGTAGSANYATTDYGLDRFLEDASFFRIRNLTLGYTLPDNVRKSLKISGLRIYLSANNLLTVTNFKGYDPEIKLRNGSNYQGVLFEGSEAPRTAIYSIGASLKF